MVQAGSLNFLSKVSVEENKIFAEVQMGGAVLNILRVPYQLLSLRKKVSFICQGKNSSSMQNSALWLAVI